MSRIIKRYENRKLYDTQTSRYISLGAIAELIRNGETVKILDKDGEQDLTNHMLINIILDEGKKGKSALPDELLHELIRWGTKVVDDGISRVRTNIDQLIRDAVSRIFSAPSNDEVDQLKEKIARLEETIEKLSALPEYK